MSKYAETTIGHVRRLIGRYMAVANKDVDDMTATEHDTASELAQKVKSALEDELVIWEQLISLHRRRWERATRGGA